MGNMNREQYNPNANLGSFSEWHRKRLIRPFRWIDIDYLGYQIVYGEYKPYVAIERIRLTNNTIEEGPTCKPLENHKKQVYSALAKKLDIPAYTMWHTDQCYKFMLEAIANDRGQYELHGGSELMDFLDELCRQQFGSLNYR